MLQVSVVSETNYQYQIRDSAACAVALLSLREAGPKLARALLTGPDGGLIQALCMLYRRSIDPKEASSLVGIAVLDILVLHIKFFGTDVSQCARWFEAESNVPVQGDHVRHRATRVARRNAATRWLQGDVTAEPLEAVVTCKRLAVTFFGVSRCFHIPSRHACGKGHGSRIVSLPVAQTGDSF